MSAPFETGQGSGSCEKRESRRSRAELVAALQQRHHDGASVPELWGELVAELGADAARAVWFEVLSAFDGDAQT